MRVERGGDGTVLMDAEALAVWCGVSERTVRRRCVPARPRMYEAATAREVLSSRISDVAHTVDP